MSHSSLNRTAFWSYCQVDVLVNSKYFVAVRREAEIWVNCPYLKSRLVWRQHFSYKILSTKCFHNWTTESKWAVDNKLKVACGQNGYFKTCFDLCLITIKEENFLYTLSPPWTILITKTMNSFLTSSSTFQAYQKYPKIWVLAVSRWR